MQIEERPWEYYGCARLDCEPHRSALLLFLGNVCMVLGALSLLLVFPALLGLPLALAVGAMVKKDIALMNAGRMDPEGAEPAMMASIRADYGAFLCLICWIPGLVIFSFIF
jgi:hypothetical protein